MFYPCGEKVYSVSPVKEICSFLIECDVTSLIKQVPDTWVCCRPSSLLPFIYLICSIPKPHFFFLNSCFVEFLHTMQASSLSFFSFFLKLISFSYRPLCVQINVRIRLLKFTNIPLKNLRWNVMKLWLFTKNPCQRARKREATPSSEMKYFPLYPNIS